jgi:probable rRNA maturation factor
LHLAGYDDLVPVKKRAMRRAERRALALLRGRRVPPAFRWR